VSIDHHRILWSSPWGGRRCATWAMLAGVWATRSGMRSSAIILATIDFLHIVVFYLFLLSLFSIPVFILVSSVS
jgi:hypothetical protein